MPEEENTPVQPEEEIQQDQSVAETTENEVVEAADQGTEEVQQEEATGEGEVLSTEPEEAEVVAEADAVEAPGDQEAEATVEETDAEVTEAAVAAEDSPVEEAVTAEAEGEDAAEAEDAGDAGEGDDSEADEAPADPESPEMLVLKQILENESSFDSMVEKATPGDLVLLMEAIGRHGEVQEFVQRVGLVKKAFDGKTDEETTEKTLLSRFSTALARFNKRRSQYYAEREKEKAENSRRKDELLEQLRVIVQEEQVTKIAEVRQIQQDWRETGWVLQEDLERLNQTYKQYLDVFYNLRGKYNDLLEIDRQYNLDEKQKIIAEIESLIPEDGATREVWTERSQRIKTLQEDWKGVGHVPRESLDEINSAYRNAMDQFFEMRSHYYELQDQKREENAARKQEMLDKLAAYGSFESDAAKDWNRATKAILAIQEDWKKIGPGPKEVNKDLWKQYRAHCDNFFNRKGEYFKKFDEKRSENLDKKIAICEEAEQLAASEDFKATAKRLKELQKEWKDIGPVHERHSNKVWKRFRKACDTFFDRRSDSASADKSAFKENLEQKEALIKELEALVAGGDLAGKLGEFQALQAKWKATGHVPFKEKDRINKGFKDAIDSFFDKADLDRSERDRLKLEARIGSGGGGSQDRGKQIDFEIRKVQGRIRTIQEKVDQYELNIQYISKGKSGDPLRKQIQGQIDQEKKAIEGLKKKVKELRKMKEAPADAPDTEEVSGSGEEE